MKENGRITVLLAEDHAIVREGLRLMLEGEATIEVIAEAGTGSEAVAAVEERPPDVALIDITMPQMNGLEATRRIKEIAPQVRVLMLTVHANVEYVVESYLAGASGYIMKETEKATLIDAIRRVAAGAEFVCPSLPDSVIRRHLQRARETEKYKRYELLTPREREVFQLLAEDRTNREIAQMLNVSVKTVETHRRNLMKKLDVTSLTELVKVAISVGVIQGRINDRS
ncbi:MAG: response regulator transcription factor [Candidatus Promineifilaceae bacterium]|nr:response regulator transcription factor [Candidatus Promineifilaceae bacterium]